MDVADIPGSSKCVKFVPKFTQKTYQGWQKFYISGRSRYTSIYNLQYIIQYIGFNYPPKESEGLLEKSKEGGAQIWVPGTLGAGGFT